VKGMSPLMTLRRTCAIDGLALLLASCAGHENPSAEVRETVDTSWLAGTWRGMAAEASAVRATSSGAWWRPRLVGRQ